MERQNFKEKNGWGVFTGSGLPYEKKELAVLCHQREVISKAGLMEPAGKPRWGGGNS